MIEEIWMKKAIELAKEAFYDDEVPVGALIIKDNEIIAQGKNNKENSQNVLGHAEINAIIAAQNSLNTWRLENTILVSTLEPCVMCAGVIVQSRIQKVIWGASDPKGGCAGSLMNLLNYPKFNHQVDIVSGVQNETCSQLLKKFFKSKRLK